jgi:hypothetical protein
MFIKKTYQKFADMSVYHKVEIPWLDAFSGINLKLALLLDTAIASARESVKKVNMNKAMKMTLIKAYR